MKIKCSLLASVLVVCAVAFTGCGITGRKNTGQKRLFQYPNNTLVIKNETPYRLTVLKNGVPWLGENKDLMFVMPGRRLAIYQCTSTSREYLSVSFLVEKLRYVSDHKFTAALRFGKSRDFVVEVGPEFFSQGVEVTKDDIKRYGTF